MESRQIDLKNCENTVLGSRKIYVEESVQDLRSNITYVKRIFAEESYVPGQYLSLNKVNVQNQIYYGNNTPPSNALIECNTYNRSCDNLHDETPMEVDLSNSNDEKLIKKIHEIEKINLRNRRNKASNKDVNIVTSSRLVPLEKSLLSNFSKILLALTVLSTMIGLYFMIIDEHFIYVNKKLQIESLKSELKDAVLYQDEALKVLIKNMERMEMWDHGIKVLPFIGTTGVGKTFTANIIKKHFFPQLVHEITNLKEDYNKHVINLNSCCCNLIIVDNLKASDLDILLNLLRKLPKSQEILFIPIFNIHNTSDGVTYQVSEEDFRLIREKFDKSSLYYDLVIYDVLEYRAVENWLRGELHKKEININRHDGLVKDILNHDNIKYKGFKGLDAKLLLSLN